MLSMPGLPGVMPWGHPLLVPGPAGSSRRPAEVPGPMPKPEAFSILSFLRCCGWVGSSMQQVCRFLGCLLDLCVRWMLQQYIPVHCTFLRSCLYERQIKQKVSMQPARKMSCVMLFSQEQSYIYLYLFRALFCFSTHGVGLYKRSSEFAIYFFHSYLLKLNGQAQGDLGQAELCPSVCVYRAGTQEAF